MSSDPSFRMTVLDIFFIKHRGTIVTGKIENGTLAVGNEIRIQGMSSSKTTKVTGIEMFRKVVDQAKEGDLVGVQLNDIGKDDVQRGDVLTGL